MQTFYPDRAPARISPLVAAIVLGVTLCGLGSFGQSIPGAPPPGGSTSLPPSSDVQARVSGRSLDDKLVVVPEDFAKLKLASGFLLSLQVYDMPEISSELRVDNSGDILVPLAGKVHVSGLTLPQAQAAIVHKLQRSQILNDPEINLNVIQYAADDVSVLGEVASPGRIQILAPHSLPDVLAMVGGETSTAGDAVTIRRMVDSKPETLQVPYVRTGDAGDIRNVMVQPGDTIIVPRAGIVYVLGGVNRPGGYVMQENGTLNVAEALSLAYGTSLDAAVGSIRVIRRRPGGALETIPVPYRKITKGEVTPMTLQPEDILYVPVSRFKSVMTAGILSSTSAAMVYTMH